MKHCSGSRPSTWQNCWTWLAAFWGWISTTSPAAKLYGKAMGGVGRTRGSWGHCRTKRVSGRAGGSTHPGCCLRAPPCRVPLSALGTFKPQTMVPLRGHTLHGSPGRTLPAWCLRLSPDPGACNVKLNQTDVLEVRGPGDPLVGDHGCQEGLQL